MVKVTYLNDSEVSIDGKIITRDYLKEQYISLNKQSKQIAKELGVSLSCFDSIRRHFCIIKDNKLVSQNRSHNLQEKYGVNNVSQISKIKEKKKQKSLSKYGVENVSQSSEVKQRKIQTFLKHYGVKHYFQTQEFKDKSVQSCLNTFGVTNCSKNQEIKNKIKQTNIDKYGCEWTCMRTEARIRSSNQSVVNKNFAALLEKNNIEYEREKSIHSFNYDFRVGDLLIELNPTATHNVDWNPFTRDHLSNIDNNYHYQKTETARQAGYRCVHLWDWDNADVLINLLSNREKIVARKCKVEKISKEEARSFLENNHFQGWAQASICLGLFYNQQLYAVMTFGKPRYNHAYQYELVRYCSAANVTGGLAKLFSYFIKQYKPQSIVSYCDLSKFTGDSYIKLGFKLLRCHAPSLHWYNIKTHEHFTDNLIRQLGFSRIVKGIEPTEDLESQGKSNNQLLLENGFVRVYDCGQNTYVWNEN